MHFLELQDLSHPGQIFCLVPPVCLSHSRHNRCLGTLFMLCLWMKMSYTPSYTASDTSFEDYSKTNFRPLFRTLIPEAPLTLSFKSLNLYFYQFLPMTHCMSLCLNNFEIHHMKVTN